MCIHFDPNFKAATQSINFFALKAGGSIDMLRALKLVFLADRYHIRKYGRPITGDTYWAMDYGPVGTLAKDIAERSEYLGTQAVEYSSKYLEPSDVSHRIATKDEMDYDPFSDSDIEALEFVWDKFHRYGPFQLVNITHGYPEWKKFKENLEQPAISREEMDYEDFFEDPSEDDPDLRILGNQDPFSEVVTSEQKIYALEVAKKYSEMREEWRR